MIKVLIVDDSKTACQFLIRQISEAPDMEIVGAADNPYMARDMIVSLQPDVVTLDIEMPNMDGLTFLGKLMRFYPLPVIVVSTHTPMGTDLALRALAAGALDVMEKPNTLDTVSDFGEMIVDKIRTASQTRRANARRRALSSSALEPIGPLPDSCPYKVIAIGASIGGIEAIQELLPRLPGNSPGILIVQHLPEPFTGQFARQLDANCDLEVRVAAPGDQIRPGLVLIAGGDKHLLLRGSDSRYFTVIKEGPPVHGHCPSVDVLFHSVASCAGPEAIGVLLTGMGTDGSQGLLAMRRAGARTFGQDEKSCVVFGMPKVAIELGAVDKVVPLSRMANEIVAAISLVQRQPGNHSLQYQS
jgi:two-component system, chemotaxis family, protein-glutamate methylesterase/glutaminase